jgi:hypothetical protein
LPAGIDSTELVKVMGRDKKVVDQGVTFVLDGPYGLEVVAGVATAPVSAAVDDMRP